jgi:hypothetical protein
MAPGVSKGHALQLVLDELAIDTADCLAFGDGQNDIELLQTVGHPRVMANAHPASQLPQAQTVASNVSPAWPCICAIVDTYSPCEKALSPRNAIEGRAPSKAAAEWQPFVA